MSELACQRIWVVFGMNIQAANQRRGCAARLDQTIPDYTEISQDTRPVLAYSKFSQIHIP
jgi:hypothetical protein